MILSSDAMQSIKFFRRVIRIRHFYGYIFPKCFLYISLSTVSKRGQEVFFASLEVKVMLVIKGRGDTVIEIALTASELYKSPISGFSVLKDGIKNLFKADIV